MPDTREFNRWVRVHSDADEEKSDEEFLTRNIILGAVEKLLDAPDHVESIDKNMAWWREEFPDQAKVDAVINEAAENIVVEWKSVYNLDNLKWWLKNNISIARQEDLPIEEAIDETIDAFKKNPNNFGIPDED